MTTGLKAAIRRLWPRSRRERTVEWTLRTLAGDPARALARLAAETNAPMIIVGTSERGFSHRLSEALNGRWVPGSRHHQSRPVLVVPYRMPAHEDS